MLGITEAILLLLAGGSNALYLTSKASPLMPPFLSATSNDGVVYGPFLTYILAIGQTRVWA